MYLLECFRSSLQYILLSVCGSPREDTSWYNPTDPYNSWKQYLDTNPAFDYARLQKGLEETGERMNDPRFVNSLLNRPSISNNTPRSSSGFDYYS